MHFLQFVFELAFVFICFDILWNIFLFILKTFLGIDRKRNTTAYYLLKGISLYILTSLTVVITFRHLEIHEGPLNHTSYPIIALIVLYLYIASSMQKNRLKAKLTMDKNTMRRIRFNGFFLTSALAYYGIATYLSVNNEELFISWVIENEIVSWFISTIAQIYDILLFKIIIGFLAILLVFNMTVKGILTTRLLIFSFFGIPDKARERMNKRFHQSEKKPDDGYTEYEIVEEDEKKDASDNEEKRLE